MAMTRRALLLAALAAPAAAQPRNEEPLRELFGIAEMQRHAARLAAGRDTRPEVKAYAARMATFREAQVPRLRDFLAQRGIADPVMAEDQEAVWQSLETLDFLALSRRYAEVQLRALDIEVDGYGRAMRSGDAAIRDLAAAMLPELERLREEARGIHRAMAP